MLPVAAVPVGLFYPPPPPPVDDEPADRLGAVVEGLRRDTERVRDEVRALRRDLRRAVAELRDALAYETDCASDDDDDEGDEGFGWRGARARAPDDRTEKDAAGDKQPRGGFAATGATGPGNATSPEPSPLPAEAAPDDGTRASPYWPHAGSSTVEDVAE